MTRLAHSLAAVVDRTWPWLPLGLLAGAVLVFWGSYVGGPGRSPAEEVNETVERFAIAVANSDGDEVCSLATEAARRRLRGSLTELGCAEAVRNFGVGIPGRQLRDAPRREPRLTGERATVAVPSIGVRLVLVRREGQWRVDALDRFAAHGAG